MFVLGSGSLQHNALAVRITVVTGGFAIASSLVGGLLYLSGRPSDRDLLEAATHAWAERDKVTREKLGKEDKVLKLLLSNAAAAYPLIEKMGSEERKHLNAQVKDLLGEMQVGCSDSKTEDLDSDLIEWKIRTLNMLNKLEIVNDIASEDS